MNVICFLDINECAKSTTLCGKHSKCANAPGSYKCLCGDGYRMDGKVCKGLLEAVYVA